MAAGAGSWKNLIHTQNKSSDQTRGEAKGSHSIEYEPDLGWGYRQALTVVGSVRETPGEPIDSQQGV